MTDTNHDISPLGQQKMLISFIHNECVCVCVCVGGGGCTPANWRVCVRARVEPNLPNMQSARVYYIAICGLHGSIIFFDIIA
jgi:hypothetical protein